LTVIDKSADPNKRDPEGVRRDILTTASKIFAQNGLSGARIDEIAASTKTSKRMIYYYFGDKDGLYKACLEAAYKNVRAGENALDLSGLSPKKALAELVGFTFDHHRKNPDFIRLVMIENIHMASFLTSSEIVKKVNTRAIETLRDIIERGQAQGVFRADLAAVELHWQISALSFFNISNRPTFSALFGTDLYTDDGQSQLRDHVINMILSFTAHKGPNDDN
jgi:AcrR family transcriptional regulator